MNVQGARTHKDNLDVNEIYIQERALFNYKEH